MCNVTMIAILTENLTIHGNPHHDPCKYWDTLIRRLLERMGHPEEYAWEDQAGARMYDWGYPAPWRSMGRRECTAPGWGTLLRYGNGPGSVVVRCEPPKGAAAAANQRWMGHRRVLMYSDVLTILCTFLR